MPGAWTVHGPISLPPRSMAYGAGALVAALAVLGLALGFQAAQRQPSAPGLASDTQEDPADRDMLTARPIVELPPPAAAPMTDAEADAAEDKASSETKDLATQAAAAQAIQAKPSKPAGNIDDILTSPAEKPPAPVKTQSDEAPPGAPVKSDVPF